MILHVMTQNYECCSYWVSHFYCFAVLICWPSLCWVSLCYQHSITIKCETQNKRHSESSVVRLSIVVLYGIYAEWCCIFVIMVNVVMANVRAPNKNKIVLHSGMEPPFYWIKIMKIRLYKNSLALQIHSTRICKINEFGPIS